jgi:DNA-binding HxlR family transcriptional regulator
MDSTHVGTQRLLIEVADVLGHKWHPVILTQLLGEESLTFSGLQSAIDGISNKMLSDSLSTLENEALIDREVVTEKPVRVRYTLTDRGRELESVLDPMVRWGRDHLDAGPTGGSAEPTTGEPTEPTQSRSRKPRRRAGGESDE